MSMKARWRVHPALLLLPALQAVLPQMDPSTWNLATGALRRPISSWTLKLARYMPILSQLLAFHGVSAVSAVNVTFSMLTLGV